MKIAHPIGQKDLVKSIKKTDLVRTVDCSLSLPDGYSLERSWIDMQDETKIVVDIQSNEEVRVKLKDITRVGDGFPVLGYEETGRVLG